MIVLAVLVPLTAIFYEVVGNVVSSWLPLGKDTSATIQGKILGPERKGLPDALVSIQGFANEPVATGEDGGFRLSAYAAPGNVLVLDVKKPGYVSTSSPYRVGGKPAEIRLDRRSSPRGVVATLVTPEASKVKLWIVHGSAATATRSDGRKFAFVPSIGSRDTVSWLPLEIVGTAVKQLGGKAPQRYPAGSPINFEIDGERFVITTEQVLASHSLIVPERIKSQDGPLVIHHDVDERDELCLVKCGSWTMSAARVKCGDFSCGDS